MPEGSRRSLALIVLPYAAFAAVWIVLSDRLLNLLVSDPHWLGELQTYKGLVFVAVTSVLLYFLVRRQQRRRDSVESERDQLRRRFLSMVESITDGFVALDRDWRYLYVNARAAEMFGRRPRDLVGKHIWTEFPEGVGQPFHRAYERALAEQKPVYLEEYYPPWDRWFENRIYPTPDGLTILFQDITERKRTEAQLLRMSRLYNTLSQTNQAIVRATDSATLLQQVCDIAVDAGGFRLAWIGLPEGDWFRVAGVAGPARGYVEGIRVSTRADLPEGQGPSGHTFRSGEHFICDDFSKSPLTAPWHEHASRFGIAGSAVFPLWQNGRIVGVLNIYAGEPDYFQETEMRLMEEMAMNVSFALDILEQQRALRENEQDLRTILDNLPIMVFAKDAQQLRFVRLNRALEEFLGKSREELLGKTDRDLFPAEQAEFFLAKDRETLAGGRTVDIPEEPIDAVEGKRLLHTRKVVVRDLDGRPRYLLGISEDITERKQAERKIEEYAARLLAAQEEERRRIARELHDQAGQALTALKLTLQTPATANTRAESLALADEVLTQVRALSFDLRPSLLDDLGLPAALRGYAERLCQRAQLALRLELAEFATRPAGEIETACFRIAQEALTNVVRHARAAAVTLTLQRENGAILLAVRDDGRGFDPAHAADASLGLLGMQERAELAGGRLEIESAPGRGATVRARLPWRARGEDA